MTSPALDKLTEIQDLILHNVEQTEQLVVDSVRRAAEFTEGYVPEVTIPALDSLPTLSEVVANQFDFAAKVLDQQRTFAEALVDATRPVADKLVLVEAEAPTTKSKKTAAAAA